MEGACCGYGEQPEKETSPSVVMRQTYWLRRLLHLLLHKLLQLLGCTLPYRLMLPHHTTRGQLRWCKLNGATRGCCRHDDLVMQRHWACVVGLHYNRYRMWQGLCQGLDDADRMAWGDSHLLAEHRRWGTAVVVGCMGHHW